MNKLTIFLSNFTVRIDLWEFYFVLVLKLIMAFHFIFSDNFQIMSTAFWF